MTRLLPRSIDGGPERHGPSISLRAARFFISYKVDRHQIWPSIQQTVIHFSSMIN